MLRFVSLTIRNFLSYGNNTTVVQLNRPGTTLIVGEDLDNTSNGQGANGVGKASWADALVKTPNGWIRMGDIQVGQMLQMPDGSVAPVTGVFPQGKQPLYKVTFMDGRSTKVTKEHLWTTFSHRWGKQDTRGVKTVTTDELIQYLKESEERNNDPWYNIFVPTVTHPTVSDKDLPIDPYALGALLGDGCLSTPSLRFSTMDVTILDTIRRNLFETDCCFSKDTNIPDWRINGKDIKRAITALGLYGTKSNTKFIPHEYLEGTSKQQKLDLLAGLLDTDGTVNKTKNVSFCSVSEQLTKDVQYLVRSLGGKATITTRKPFYKNKEGNKIEGQKAYNVSIRYPNPRELFQLDRKRELLSEGETQYTNEGLRITSILPAGDGEAQCIMVDHPDHLYITDEFIVTHNTVIINALAYGMYDKPISNISKDNLVNNINKKNMEVTVTFERNGKFYFIRRVRRSKAGASGNYVQLFERCGDMNFTEEDEITRDSVSNTNALIEKIVGIPYELFVRIVVFSATHIPFLDLPIRHQTAPSQTSIIEELFELTELAEDAEELKHVIKDTELLLDRKKDRVGLLEKEHIKHADQIKKAKWRVLSWENQNTETIAELEETLKKVSEVDIESQRSLHAELVEVEHELSTSLEAQRVLEQSITRTVKVKKKKEEELVHLRDAKCPYCLQKYTDAQAKIAECESEVAQSEEKIQSLSLELEGMDSKVAGLTKKHGIVKASITVPNLEELIEIKSQSASIRDRIAELQNATNPFIEPLDELEEIKLDNIGYEEINNLTKLVEHQRFLLKLLTKKDSFVRKALLNKNIPFLNSRLQQYLSDLGLPHTVEFTHELTAEISQFSRPLDFGNLSNGQRARVNLALSFAFRDVLQKLHTRINVCMLDEVLDVGLDAVGVQSAARMLKRKGRDENLSLYIISHRDEIDSAFDSTMTIQMTKGFSYIKEE